MSRTRSRVPRTPKESTEPLTDQQVRMVMREHSELIKRRRGQEPATGNQLWRLNSLGLLLSISAEKWEKVADIKVDVTNGQPADALYITQEEAHHWLQAAKDDGIW